MKNLNKLIFKTAILILVVFSTSCKKFLDVGSPKTEIGIDQVFNSDIVATDAILSIYGDMMNGISSILAKTTPLLGQAADEMLTVQSSAPYYTNGLLSTVQYDDFWTAAYKEIFYVNTAISKLSGSAALTPAVKQQLLGEALFLRAYMHFYLVNLFGDVPYITSTDYKVTSVAVRMPVDDVYKQIIVDLKQAKTLLTNNFPDASNNMNPSIKERIRANKGAAGALLARVYLYHQEWHNAELEADTIINNTTNYGLVAVNAVFLKNSIETILSIPSTDPSHPNTLDATNFILAGAPSPFYGQSISLTSNFYNTAFQAGDKRKTSWIGSYTNISNTTWYYAYKYHDNSTTTAASEYWIVLRLAEQYLIRAEARAQLNNVEGAVADINILRARARVTPTDLPDYRATISQPDCLAAIMQERRVELFAEGGHRWMDLKRTGQADVVLGPLKGSNWQTTDQLFPIPDAQFTFDPAMTGHQNPGY